MTGGSRLSWSTRCELAALPKAWVFWPRPTGSMRGCWLNWAACWPISCQWSLVRPSCPGSRTFWLLREKHVDARTMLNLTASEVDEGAAVAVATIAHLDAQIATLEATARALIAAETEQAERFGILTSIPGVGFVTAAALLCWMPELGSLGPRQAAALIGVAPFADDSGQSRGARHIRGGRRRPRNALFMAATTASRHNNDLKIVFERLKASGKAHKVAITALMRKLVVLANALLRDQRLWSPEAPARPVT